jgi:crossover junction endodeoxyribonuclease RusA
MTKFEMPWPFPGLWPNDRPHWAMKSKAVKSYREGARYMARVAKTGPIRVTFCPKPRGVYPDMDNCIAAFKAAQDGIADALKVNDRDLTVTYAFGERCKYGAVIVEIGEPGPEPMP